MNFDKPVRVDIDPGLLQLLGKVSEFLGLAEHAERILNTQRRRSQSRHRAIAKAWTKFQKGLTSGRGALRQIRSTLAAQLTDAPADTVAIAMSYGEFNIFRDGIQQLHRAIGDMTNAAYDLESLTEPVGDEVERFYRISEAGQPILGLLRDALGGHPERIPDLLDATDRHFDRCEHLIAERSRWLEK